MLMNDKRSYNTPFPHQKVPAQLKNIDLYEIYNYRCMMCGRTLLVRNHSDFIFCPFHGSLQLNQLVIPNNPRKKNPIDSTRIKGEKASRRQIELDIFTKEDTHPIGE